MIGDLLVLAAGYGVLRLVAPRAKIGGAGALALSWLCGVCALAVVTTYAGVLGLPLNRWLVALPLLALALAPRLPRLPRPGQALLPAGLGLLVGARIVAAASHVPTVRNDEYAIWALRGRALATLGRLDPRVFAAPQALYQHLDYPLLVPSVIAWSSAWGGGEKAAHVHVSMLVAALLGVIGWGVARLAGTAAGVVAVLAALAPRELTLLSGRLLGDLAAATYAVAAVLLLLVWLREEEPWQVRLAAVMTTGAAFAKNEGAAFALAACVIVAVLARRRAPAYAAGVAVLAYVPWLVWLRVHHITNDVVNGDAGERAALTGHRLHVVATGIGRYWPLGWWWLALFAGAAYCAVRRGAWRHVVALAGAAAAAVGILAVIYVVTPLEVVGHIHDSAHRVLMFPALLVAVGVPLLAGLREVAPAAGGRREGDG
jgi:hypothetical protein